MPKPTGFHRTNINLLEADVEWLRAHFGTGWTVVIRTIIGKYVKEHRQKQEEFEPLFATYSEIDKELDDD